MNANHNRFLIFQKIKIEKILLLLLLLSMTGFKNKIQNCFQNYFLILFDNYGIISYEHLKKEKCKLFYELLA